MRSVRALPRAAVLVALTLAAVEARAAGPPSLWPDLESWWSEPGNPAQTPDGWLGIPFPRSLAGLVRGSWTLETPGRAPEALPWPGVLAARRPAVWYDSVRAGAPAGGDWGGPDAGLAEVQGLRRTPVERRARSVFSLASGDFGTDAYGLGFERGDSLKWLRAEAATARRGPVGALGLAGSHVWGASGGLARGRHRFEAAYTERGSAGELREALAAEAAAGESGEIGWRYLEAHTTLGLRLMRGHDHHESFDNSFGTVLPYSRRDAQENRAVIVAEHATAAGLLGARLDWRQGAVRRSDDPTFDVRGNTWWGAGAFQRRVMDGRLRLEVGGGRLGGLGRSAWAPRASYAFGAGAVQGQVFAARLITPVWTDLASGQAAFLQRTWAGGFELLARPASRVNAHTSLLIGLTRDRALLVRYPLEDVWLRVGTTADPERYGFGLAELGLDWRAGGLGAGTSGYVLWRDVSALQPRVDPGTGVRAYGEYRCAAFQRDLGIAVRGEIEGVGVREGEFSNRRLPEYLSFGGSMTMTLADATVTLRARNLENRRREEVWVDPVSGVEALGPGREFRFMLSWRLFD